MIMAALELETSLLLKQMDLLEIPISTCSVDNAAFKVVHFVVWVVLSVSFILVQFFSEI